MTAVFMQELYIPIIPIRELQYFHAADKVCI